MGKSIRCVVHNTSILWDALKKRMGFSSFHRVSAQIVGG